VDGRDGNASWGERGRVIPSLRGRRRHGEEKAWRGERERKGGEGALSVSDRQCQAHGAGDHRMSVAVQLVLPLCSAMDGLTHSVAVLKNS